MSLLSQYKHISALNQTLLMCCQPIKVFKGDVSPDGRAVDELEISCAVDHPNIIKFSKQQLVVDVYTHVTQYTVAHRTVLFCT
eukprot:17040-Heterococcus_DN1.PRE.1